eukprot:COSAG02_NODE_21648_length_780_cov_1.061674_2_plen_55_part_01
MVGQEDEETRQAALQTSLREWLRTRGFLEPEFAKLGHAGDLHPEAHASPPRRSPY